MDWLWLAGAALLGFFVGTSQRVRQKLNAPLVQQLNDNLAQDRERGLFTFRRELANYMVRNEPDRYLQLYREARRADIGIHNASKQSREAQLAELTAKYPTYDDFDLISAREHVLYAATMTMHSREEIEDHFLNMVKFQALQHALNEHWQRFPATTDKNLEHLETYVRKIKDTQFKPCLSGLLPNPTA
jgi:hypothetical protein